MERIHCKVYIFAIPVGSWICLGLAGCALLDIKIYHCKCHATLCSGIILLLEALVKKRIEVSLTELVEGCRKYITNWKIRLLWFYRCSLKMIVLTRTRDNKMQVWICRYNTRFWIFLLLWIPERISYSWFYWSGVVNAVMLLIAQNVSRSFLENCLLA